MNSPLKRSSWEQYFLDMATLVSTRATCPVAGVGSVFVNPKSKTVLSTGYNGAARGTEHCDKCDNRKMGTDTHLCKAIHAEINGIYNAANNGIKLHGSWLYNTVAPCLNCSKAIVQVGVDYVIFSATYVHTEGLDLLREAKIGWIHWMN